MLRISRKKPRSNNEFLKKMLLKENLQSEIAEISSHNKEGDLG